ncbi:MAG: dephospho-CoA kinase [Oxalicibacterium faecigallinarum]|uniref:dephospho-CoA kinase n=1 Tax=Oxalicibacterium faecigallinarum TaxID=573741 RepID=UPI002806AFC8|nr:dephospho-CoA kinase [Oxalicibacterium faecigallinarum]MDQ7969771.1 dephospho-CoA kinase [Oxalicibacterium faecigallinarum]
MRHTEASRFSIGLTGGIGSGKSTVADLFAKLGASIVDTDLIAHQLTAPEGLAIEPIRQAFGTAFITQDGALDRKKMRDAVFGDPTQKKRLESILHPLIRAETERAARQASGTYVIFVVPLLVESGTWIQRVSRVLVVDCPEEVQRQRVMQRSGLSEAQVNAIMASQASRTDRLAAADDIILNDGDSSLLHAAVERLHSRYQALALEASGL